MSTTNNSNPPKPASPGIRDRVGIVWHGPELSRRVGARPDSIPLPEASPVNPPAEPKPPQRVWPDPAMPASPAKSRSEAVRDRSDDDRLPRWLLRSGLNWLR